MARGGAALLCFSRALAPPWLEFSLAAPAPRLSWKAGRHPRLTQCRKGPAQGRGRLAQGRGETVRGYGETARCRPATGQSQNETAQGRRKPVRGRDETAQGRGKPAPESGENRGFLPVRAPGWPCLRIGCSFPPLHSRAPAPGPQRHPATAEPSRRDMLRHVPDPAPPCCLRGSGTRRSASLRAAHRPAPRLSPSLPWLKKPAGTTLGSPGECQVSFGVATFPSRRPLPFSHANQNPA